MLKNAIYRYAGQKRYLFCVALQLRYNFGRPFLEIAGLDMGAGVFHELQEKMQVVNGR